MDALRGVGMQSPTKTRKSSRTCTAEESWRANLRDIEVSDPNFFTSDDAKLSRESSTWKERLAYDGLNATLANCLAVQRLYDVFYKAKELQQIGSEEEFHRLCSTVSQYLRLCVAHLFCAKDDVYRTEVLFVCVASLELTEGFMDFVLECRSARTALRKARHLRTVCRAAWEFMNTDHARSRLRSVSQYLTIVIDGIRSNSARSALITDPQCIPFDLLKKCMRTAMDTMSDWISWHKFESRSGVSLNQNQLRGLVTEWTSAFIPFLVLCSGGQSPQVITHIQVPCDNTFKENIREAHRIGYIRLSTLHGKRTLCLGLPEVILSDVALPYLGFHVFVILPTIYSLTKKVELQNGWRAMLVNKMTGDEIKSWRVAYEVKRFFSEVDPRFSNVTCKSLRSTCMLVLLGAFREKRLLNGRDESHFLDITARYFNTTKTQLRSNVGCRGSAAHRATAEELTMFLSKASEYEVRNRESNGDYHR